MQAEAKGGLADVRREGRRDSVTKGSEKLPPDARLFAHPRLEICGAIARRAGVSFRLLCDELELSDGNLSAHLRALENELVIAVERTFDGRRRLSQYRLTDGGRERLRAYVDWVQSFVRALEPHVADGGSAGAGVIPGGRVAVARSVEPDR
ncbi:MAG: transcriptional regulator [Deltaproteobacteria bacterium]|nr:transcriptional regulator [Deltaproteobacteria bacterium]